MTSFQNPRRLRLASASAVVGTAALLLAGCTGGGGGDGSSGAAPAADLAVITPAPFASWDPTAIFTPYGGGLYTQAVYDTLIKETADGEFEPDLATDWSYDDALTTLTMNLRTDVTFTDGTAFDAEAAVTNLERNRTTPGPRIADLANVSSVTVVDDDTIELTLSQPDPGLVEQLARTVGQMVSTAAIESGDFDTPVGTGPYVLDTANTVDGESYAFTRNEDYWNTDAWPYAAITVDNIGDPTARLNALKAQQVDATLLEFTQVADAESAGLNTVTNGGGVVGIQFLDLAGATNPALADARVRQAINYAIDADAMADAFGAGQARVTDQLFGPDDSGYVADLDGYYDHDVDKATSLLAEAGYPDGITLTLPDSSGAFPGTPIMATIAQQLAEAGITVDIVDSELAFPDIVNQMFAAVYPAWTTQLAIGSNWNVVSQSLLPSSPFNPFHDSDPQVDALISGIRTATGDDQVAAYQALNTYLVENAYGAYFYATPYAYAYNDTVAVTPHVGEQSPWLADLRPAS